MSQLPEGWVNSKFTDYLDINGGTQPPKKEFVFEPTEHYVRLLQIRDFGKKPVPTFIPLTSKLRLCKNEDILIGRYGASLGRICTGMEGAYNVALAKVVIPECIDNKYVKYFLSSELFQQPLRLLSRSAQNGFNKKDLGEFDFCIAPLAEQSRIVEKLGEVLAQVDFIKARLDGIPDILKRFRQSVLASAVSGKLTEEWRGGNTHVTAENELNSLIQVRTKIFKELKKKEKELKKTINSTELPELPSSWVYSTIAPFLDITRAGMKTGPFGSLLKKHEHTIEGIPVLGIENIRGGVFVRGSKIHITEAKAKELSGYDIKANDLIISRSGSVGDICVVPDMLGVCRFSTNIMRLSFMNGSINAHYFKSLFLGSPIVLEQIRELCKGSTRDFLNQKILSSISYPIPPIEEQKEIVRLVDQYFAFANTIEAQVKKAQARVDNLTQSILAKAFRGELVPQDPEDESADKLLARIAKARKEAEALAKAAKKAATAKKKAAKK